MARKKKFVEPKFYAYYDKASKQMFLVTNEKSTRYKDYIEITADVHEALVSGKEKFSDYIIGHVRTDDGKKVLKLIPKLQEAYTFRNTLFEIISDPVERDTEFTVKWDSTKSQWIFSMSTAAKKRTADSISDTKLVFFIILEHDYDFLIRSILIDANDLLSHPKVTVPFTTDIEQQIDRISIATKLTFESYGLIK